MSEETARHGRDESPGEPLPRASVEMPGYFEARGVREPAADETTLPAYLLPLLPADRAARILDAGCGHGGSLRALIRLGYSDVRGVEGDVAAADFCRRSGLRVESADLRSWAPAESFDLILMSHVLEHLPKDEMIPALQRLRRSLRPGGALFVAVPNAQSSTGAYWAFEDFTHAWLFTSGSLAYVARMAGFGSVRFIDIDCTASSRSRAVRVTRRALLRLYRARQAFWNAATSSAFHAPSPQIFSYEIKALLSG